MRSYMRRFFDSHVQRKGSRASIGKRSKNASFHGSHLYASVMFKPCVRACVRACVCACVRACMRACVRAYVRLLASCAFDGLADKYGVFVLAPHDHCLSCSKTPAPVRSGGVLV